MKKNAPDTVTAKPAGFHRMDPFFDGRLVDRLLLLLFGGGAAASLAADAGILEVGTAIGGSALGGSAAGAASEAVAAGATRGAASIAAESGGWFSGLFNIATNTADIIVDGMIFSDWSSRRRENNNFARDGWYNPFNPTEADAARAKAAGQRTFTKEEIAAMGPIGETLHDYGFLRQQLRLHTSKGDRLHALSAAFDAKGLALPSEAEAKDAYKHLAQVLHPDVNPDNREVAEALFKRLVKARDTLKNPEFRATYEALLKKLDDPALAETKTLVEDMLTHCSTVDWGDFYSSAMRQTPAGLLSDHREDKSGVPSTTSTVTSRPGFAARLIEDMEAASRLRQGGMVFGGISGVGLATYLSAKSWEAMHDKGANHPHHLRDAALYGTTALGGGCLSVAALNGFRLQGGALR